MHADSPAKDVVLRDYCPEQTTFLDDVVEGLSAPQKALPSKYLYDERGSELFDRICELDVYYPTRTEIEIMSSSVGEISHQIGEHALLIEYGSGSSRKTRILLDALMKPAGYVPIDISGEHLLNAARRIAAEYPGLEVMPVCADYTQDFPLPEPTAEVRTRVVYFPGSTIGNFLPDTARAFLDHVRATADALLIGVDLQKDVRVLDAAYNDPEGVTAAFNLNLLRRINRELDGDFDLSTFRHAAVYDSENHLVEMRLVSDRRQTVRVCGHSFTFEEGEFIHTEYSHKYTILGFAEMASQSGLGLVQAWTDERSYFSVQLYRSV